MNKRKDKRVSCLVPVEGKQGFDTKTVDFSKNGIGLISKTKIPLNKTIPVQLDFSADEEPVVALGKVRWVQLIPETHNYRIGLSFEGVVSGSKSRLKQYFESKT
jgi:c-di-GMP-binding flagellar brake protein YcgR